MVYIKWGAVLVAVIYMSVYLSKLFVWAPAWQVGKNMVLDE